MENRIREALVCKFGSRRGNALYEDYYWLCSSLSQDLLVRSRLQSRLVDNSLLLSLWSTFISYPKEPYCGDVTLDYSTIPLEWRIRIWPGSEPDPTKVDPDFIRRYVSPSVGLVWRAYEQGEREQD